MTRQTAPRRSLLLLCAALVSMPTCDPGGSTSSDAQDGVDVSSDGSRDGELSFRIDEQGETTVRLTWEAQPGADHYELWILLVDHISDLVDFPEAPWAVEQEVSAPPFEVTRRLDGATEQRFMLRALAGDEVLAESSEALIVNPARRPAQPHVAVGDGVAWLVWDGLPGRWDIHGDPVQWEVLRDDALIETLPAQADWDNGPVSYLDVSGLITGQIVRYQVGRLSQSGESGPASAAAEVRIRAWSAISARSQHACGLTGDAALFCWGANASGQLGAGDEADHVGAVQVLDPDGATPLTEVEAVAAGAEATCALRVGGETLCWGRDLLDRESSSPLPAALSLPIEPEAIALGHAQLCALSGGELWCLGANDHGQLGRGAVTDTPGEAAPVLDAEGAPLSSVRAFGLGAAHACALLDDGGVWCWGRASEGQMGAAGVRPHDALPVRALEEPADALWVGADEACAWCQDDRLRCWGARWTAGIVPDPWDLTPAELQVGEEVIAVTPGHPMLLTTSFGRALRHELSESLGWMPFGQEAFQPPLSGSTALAAGEGWGCTLNRDGLIVCEALCDPDVPYDRTLGCAGFRPGTAGLNTYQRSDVIYVIMEP